MSLTADGMLRDGSHTLAETLLQPGPMVSRERVLLTDPIRATLALPDGWLELSIRRPEVAWIYPVLARLQHLGSLQANWDSHGGRRISGDAIVTSLHVLGAVMEDQTPSPWIVPRSDGGLQLEWHEGARDLELLIRPDNRVALYFSDDSGAEEQSESAVGPSQTPMIRDFLSRVTG